MAIAASMFSTWSSFETDSFYNKKLLTETFLTQSQSSFHKSTEIVVVTTGWGKTV